MKKILSLLGTIALTGTSTTSLVACNKPSYTETQLKELKEKNKINIKNQTIRDNLEWIAPQEKPFKQVDNKYYFVVWNGDKTNDWRIIKFKYDKYEKNKVLDKYNNYQLQLFQTGVIGQGYWKDICLVDNKGVLRYFAWSFYPTYFKSVYRWNGDEQKLPDLIIDENGNVKINN